MSFFTGLPYSYLCSFSVPLSSYLSFLLHLFDRFLFLPSFAISFVYLFLDFIFHILLQYFSSNFTLPFSFSSISFHSLPYPFFFWSILFVSTYFSSIHSFTFFCLYFSLVILSLSFLSHLYIFLKGSKSVMIKKMTVYFVRFIKSSYFTFRF